MTFKQIKGFPAYEANTTAKIVRNIKTGKEMSIKKGTGKYYLPDTKGNKKLIALEAMQFEEDEVLETPSIGSSSPKVKKILEEFRLKHRQNYELSKLGLSKEDIADITNSTVGNVTRDLWGYKNNRYKL